MEGVRLDGVDDPTAAPLREDKSEGAQDEAPGRWDEERPPRLDGFGTAQGVGRKPEEEDVRLFRRQYHRGYDKSRRKAHEPGQDDDEDFLLSNQPSQEEGPPQSGHPSTQCRHGREPRRADQVLR